MGIVRSTIQMESICLVVSLCPKHYVPISVFLLGVKEGAGHALIVLQLLQGSREATGQSRAAFYVINRGESNNKDFLALEELQERSSRKRSLGRINESQRCLFLESSYLLVINLRHGKKKKKQKKLTYDDDNNENNHLDVSVYPLCSILYICPFSTILIAKPSIV